MEVIPPKLQFSADHPDRNGKERSRLQSSSTASSIGSQTLNAIDECETDLSALCFSGGWIRSATFGLGIMQGLARFDLLGKFHYGKQIGESQWNRSSGNGSLGNTEESSQ